MLSHSTLLPKRKLLRLLRLLLHRSRVGRAAWPSCARCEYVRSPQRQRQPCSCVLSGRVWNVNHNKYEKWDLKQLLYDHVKPNGQNCNQTPVIYNTIIINIQEATVIGSKRALSFTPGLVCATLM